MPGPFGVVSTGFNTKTLEEITTDLEARARTEFGANVDLDPSTSALGQLIKIIADRLADAWQLGQGTYAAAFPDTASGTALVLNAALTGTQAITPSVTNVEVRATGTPGTIIPIGSRFSVPSVPDAVFQTSGIPYTIGGGGTVLMSCNCVNFGPISALAGTVTQIDTPVVGLVSVTNLLDQSVLGSLAENDPALRLRREQTIRAMGGSAFEAVRARVLEVPGVTDCFVFENETDATVDTIPPHSFEVVVRGGVDAAIARAIFDAKSLAIRAYGTTVVNVGDTQGNNHGIGFTRPTTLNAYVSMTVLAAAGYQTNLANLIKAACVAYGDATYRTGSPAYAAQLVASVFSTDPKVLGFAVGNGVKIDTVITPVTESVTPTKRQIVDLDTSRITVTITAVSL